MYIPTADSGMIISCIVLISVFVNVCQVVLYNVFFLLLRIMISINWPNRSVTSACINS